MAFEITGTKGPTMSEPKVTRQQIEKFRGVIVFVIYLERFRVVGEARRILDVVNIVPKLLQSDNVMDVLPNHARNRARPHEAHDENLLSFHGFQGTEENVQRPTSNIQRPKDKRA